jgi:hypothetical protein
MESHRAGSILSLEERHGFDVEGGEFVAGSEHGLGRRMVDGMESVSKQEGMEVKHIIRWIGLEGQRKVDRQGRSER